ncbi:MAG TPA: hypothetical protein DC049_09945 [Spirochaetia bacterium]|nr:hypothetical protein [Spirochaetia bacterium]
MKKKILITAFSLCAVIAAVFIIRSAAQEEVLLEKKVISGNFTEKLYAEGEIDALNSISIIAPRIPFSRQVIFLPVEGEKVQKGELLAVFDPAPVFEHMESLSNRIMEISNRMINDIIDYDIQIYNYETDYERAGEEIKINKMNLSSVEHESDFTKSLHQVNLNNSLTYRESILTKIKDTKKRKEHNTKRHINYMEKWQKQIEDDHRYLGELKIYSPADSIVVYPVIGFGGEFRKVILGDNLTWGREFMRLPDFTSLAVKIKIEEKFIHKVSCGLNAEITFNTSPGKVLEGYVAQVSGFAVEDIFIKNKRYFDIIIGIREKSELDNLKPNMTITACLEIMTYHDVYALSRDYIVQEKNKKIFFIKNHTSIDKFSFHPDYETEDFFLVNAPAFHRLSGGWKEPVLVYRESR